MKISIEALWVRFVSTLGFAGIILGLYLGGVPLDVILGTATFLLVIFIALALALSIAPILSSVDRRLENVVERLEDMLSVLRRHPRSGRLARSKEERREVRTSGGGALAGMAIGGLIGLVGGPIGVIMGGLLGAVIGDQAEREQIKARKRTQI